MHILLTEKSCAYQMLRQFFSVDKHSGIFHLPTNHSLQYKIHVQYLQEAEIC